MLILSSQTIVNSVYFSYISILVYLNLSKWPYFYGSLNLLYIFCWNPITLYQFWLHTFGRFYFNPKAFWKSMKNHVNGIFWFRSQYFVPYKWQLAPDDGIEGKFRNCILFLFNIFFPLHNLRLSCSHLILHHIS